MNCNYTLKLNGKDYLFKSEIDLNKFLYDNKQRLTLKPSDLAKFSLDFTSTFSNQQEALSKIAPNANKGVRTYYKTNTNTSINQSGEKNEGGSKDTITGTNVHKQYNRFGKQLVADMSRDEFEGEQIKSWLKDGIYPTHEEGKKAFAQLMKEWDTLAEIGRAHV